MPRKWHGTAEMRSDLIRSAVEKSYKHSRRIHDLYAKGSPNDILANTYMPSIPFWEEGGPSAGFGRPGPKEPIIGDYARMAESELEQSIKSQMDLYNPRVPIDKLHLEGWERKAIETRSKFYRSIDPSTFDRDWLASKLGIIEEGGDWWEARSIDPSSIRARGAGGPKNLHGYDDEDKSLYRDAMTYEEAAQQEETKIEEESVPLDKKMNIERSVYDLEPDELASEEWLRSVTSVGEPSTIGAIEGLPSRWESSGVRVNKKNISRMLSSAEYFYMTDDKARGVDFLKGYTKDLMGYLGRPSTTASRVHMFDPYKLEFWREAMGKGRKPGGLTMPFLELKMFSGQSIDKRGISAYTSGDETFVNLKNLKITGRFKPTDWEDIFGQWQYYFEKASKSTNDIDLFADPMTDVLKTIQESIERSWGATRPSAIRRFNTSIHIYSRKLIELRKMSDKVLRISKKTGKGAGLSSKEEAFLSRYNSDQLSLIRDFNEKVVQQGVDYFKHASGSYVGNVYDVEGPEAIQKYLSGLSEGDIVVGEDMVLGEKRHYVARGITDPGNIPVMTKKGTTYVKYLEHEYQMKLAAQEKGTISQTFELLGVRRPGKYMEGGALKGMKDAIELYTGGGEYVGRVPSGMSEK